MTIEKISTVGNSAWFIKSIQNFQQTEKEIHKESNEWQGLLWNKFHINRKVTSRQLISGTETTAAGKSWRVKRALLIIVDVSIDIQSPLQHNYILGLTTNVIRKDNKKYIIQYREKIVIFSPFLLSSLHCIEEALFFCNWLLPRNLAWYESVVDYRL